MADHTALSRRALAGIFCAAVAAWQAPAQQTKVRNEMTQAETVLDRLRRGERFRPPAPALFPGGLAEKDLDLFAAALETDPAPVREQIVRLLADYAYRSDPLFRSGGQIFRDERIIAILAGQGLAQPGVARDAALEALQTYVAAGLLQPHAATLTANLQRFPDTTALLLIAKVKPAEATTLVTRLLATSHWSKEEATRVAAAALGDRGIEKQFTDQFVAAQDGEEKSRLAKTLGWIGTPGALAALAGQMRTDAFFEVPMSFRRSVRLDIMAALSYNFPDLVLLYENSVRTDADYARVEQFCEERFATRWDRPRPPFLTILGYPIPPR